MKDGQARGWHNSVVVVTGGSSGLGESICRQFLFAGATVVAVARDEPRLRTVVGSWSAPSDRAVAYAADVTDDGHICGLAHWLQERFGRVDVLVHAAGRSDRGTVLDTPLDRFQQLWEVNALAAVRLVQHNRTLLSRGRGHVVLIGSLASKSAARYLGGYPASKFALAAIAHQLRLEGKQHGWHVLLVCPGPLRRADAGHRYAAYARGLPPAAQRPGAGVRLSGIDPDRLARSILIACQQRQPELVVPARARWLFALQQVAPRWGDWVLDRVMSR